MEESFFDKDIKSIWIDGSEEPDLVEARFKDINSVNSIYYEFVLDYYRYFLERHDYGQGFKLTMIEAHVLTDIVDNPGITITDLAKKWQRTPSALSQTVKKLIQGGFVRRKIREDDSKFFLLNPTKKAKEFVLIHKRYDNLDSIKLYKRLLEQFSKAEIKTFFRVMKAYNKLIRNI